MAGVDAQQPIALPLHPWPRSFRMTTRVQRATCRLCSASPRRRRHAPSPCVCVRTERCVPQTPAAAHSPSHVPDCPPLHRFHCRSAATHTGDMSHIRRVLCVRTAAPPVPDTRSAGAQPLDPDDLGALRAHRPGTLALLLDCVSDRRFVTSRREHRAHGVGVGGSKDMVWLRRGVGRGCWCRLLWWRRGGFLCRRRFDPGECVLVCHRSLLILILILPPHISNAPGLCRRRVGSSSSRHEAMLRLRVKAEGGMCRLFALSSPLLLLPSHANSRRRVHARRGWGGAGGAGDGPRDGTGPHRRERHQFCARQAQRHSRHDFLGGECVSTSFAVVSLTA